MTMVFGVPQLAGAVLGIAGLVMLFSSKKVTSNLMLDKLLSIGLLVGAVFLFMMSSAETTKSNAQSVLGQDAVIDTVRLSAGVANSSTTIDTYSEDDTHVEFNLLDVTTIDDDYINVTATVTRNAISDDQLYTVTCTSEDFTKSGSTYNLVSRDSDDKLEMYFDGNSNRHEDSADYSFGFSEGTLTDTVVISFKVDESSQDAISTGSSKNVNCDFNGVPVEIEIRAAD